MKQSSPFKYFQENVCKQEYNYVKTSIQLISAFIVPEKIQHLYLSFNGGKDATAVLFLTLFALQKQLGIYQSPLSPSLKLKCLYFKEPNSFEEVNTFIELIRKQYQLEWYQLETKSYQQQLSSFCETHSVQFILMGSRKNDPHCQSLGDIAPSDTSKGYPKFLRINPIISWSYEQVWAFIKGFGIPYCKLYDQGYTYLGNKDNTVKNQNLFDLSSQSYKPASSGHSEIEQKSRSQCSYSERQD